MKEKRLLNVLGQVDEKYIAEAIPNKNRRKHSYKKLAIIAACLCLLFGLSIVAYASNWFGLQDLLLPDISGTSLEEKKEEGTIGLSGYKGSPEWQALAEWQAFVNEYDPDGTIYQNKDNRLDDSFARYSCYLVYSQEMADRMDEIATKYSLNLHTTSFNLQTNQEVLGTLGDFRKSCSGYYTYMYEDGTFQVDGTIQFEDIGAWDYQLLRAVKGTFHNAMLDIGEVSEYQEILYETAGGISVTLALGPDKVLILADLADSFVTVHIPYGTENGIEQIHLEKLADSINFAALTPVVKPQINDTTHIVEKDEAARKVYAATLRNLLYSNILPDGKKTETAVDVGRTYSKFGINDVDNDGKEELIILYDPGLTAASKGYILGYDTDTKEIHIQLEEYPYFAFLEHGNLKALSSHNQTWGKMWPYSLYQYLPESDIYELRGIVWSEDKAIFEANGVSERYPDYADVSGNGTVYYIDEETWGTTPTDEAEYLSWLKENQGDSEEVKIEYLALTEENVLTIE